MSWSKNDFTQKQMKFFTVTKEMLIESENTEEVNKAEVKLIVELQANNPKKGYNLWPKLKSN